MPNDKIPSGYSKVSFKYENNKLDMISVVLMLLMKVLKVVIFTYYMLLMKLLEKLVLMFMIN